MKIRSFLLVLLIILSSIPVTYGQDGSLGIEDITFEIEGGNGSNIKQIGTNRFRFDVEYDTGSSSICYWFKFKILQDALSQQVTFQARLPSEPFFSYDWLKPVYSYDGVNWHYIENREYESGVLKFTQSFTEDSVTVAVSFPYTFEELESYITSIEALPYVDTGILGYSDENRPIHLVKITDPSIDDSQKKHILLVGGQHSGETHGMLLVKGVIEYLLSAPEIRTKYVYHIVPMVNVDGVNSGNTRYDTSGMDLNREWDDDYKEPEIECIYNYMTSNSFDLVIDSHTQESGYPYFGITTGIPFYQDSIDLWECVEPYTHFDRTLDHGQLEGSLRWEAYDDFGFFSIVIEHSQTNYVWSYNTYVSEGHGLVMGIDDYFDFSEPLVHDIALTSVNAPNVLVSGETGILEITAENQGTYSETFQVVCIDETDSIIIGTQSISLDPGETSIISFNWDTSTVPIGEHLISSTADPMPDESDIIDNAISNTITVEPPIIDIAIANLDNPTFATLGDTVSVIVTVENTGNQPISEDITVILTDDTIFTIIAAHPLTMDLSPDAETEIVFTWDTGDAQFGEHILSVSHDLIDDNTFNDQMSSTITLTEPRMTMHVADIDGRIELKGKSGRWEVFLIVSVKDNNDNPVPNALIIGEWAGDTLGDVSVITGSDGTATFSTGNLPQGNTIIFKVSNLSHEVLIYEPLDNQDPDNDSDGTSIEIDKP